MKKDVEKSRHEDIAQEVESLGIRFAAVLLGGAVGDALGMPVEGWSREQIQKYAGRIDSLRDPIIIFEAEKKVIADEYGTLPSISPQLHAGEWTDDTWLAVATARSIADSGDLDLQNVAKQSLIVYEDREAVETGGEWGLFGGTTKAGFENLRRGLSPEDSGVQSRNAGNAPALKMSPVGLYMYTTGKYNEGLVFAEKIGKMTHLDARSIVSGVLQAHAVYALLNGATKEELLESMIAVAKKYEKSQEQGKKVTILSRLEWIGEHKDDSEEVAYQELMPRWSVTKNYPFTIFMLLKYWQNPVEGFIQLINYGGDCDSTGAMYGALVGAKNGMVFPQAWLEKLRGRDELENLAKRIGRLREKSD